MCKDCIYYRYDMMGDIVRGNSCAFTGEKLDNDNGCGLFLSQREAKKCPLTRDYCMEGGCAMWRFKGCGLVIGGKR